MSSHFLSAHHASAHFGSSHFGRDDIIVPPPDFTPEPVYPPGTRPRDPEILRRIREEDELLMLVIQAFLHMRNKR